MKAGQIQGSTIRLGAPANWDPARHGPCSILHVRVEGTELQSAWYPSQAEIKALQEGKPLILTVYGKDHPPVALEVEGARRKTDG